MECPQSAHRGPVELAVATALERASAAGDWNTVGILARELEARRRERVAPDVPDLEAIRKRRERDG